MCAIAQECYPNDRSAVAAANLHVFLDNLCSRDPVFKKYLEKMEILHRRKKKTRRTCAKRALEDPLISFFMKLEEVKRLFRALYSSLTNTCALRRTHVGLYCMKRVVAGASPMFSSAT